MANGLIFVGENIDAVARGGAAAAAVLLSANGSYIAGLAKTVAAQTAVILAPYRGYSSKAQAAKLIVRLGGKHQGDAFAVHFPDVHPFFARRGDVGYMDYEDGVATGVFTHQGFTCKSEEGLISVSPEKVRKAWKIEF